MSRLFGTDGVRGKAGTYPLDPPTVRRLGGALARALGHGKPTRCHAGGEAQGSGSWSEREVAFGINSQGGSLTGAGIIRTQAKA